MTIDATIRESNLRDSIKKYFVDALYTTEGIDLLFDKFLSSPKVQGNEIDKWYAIMIGEIDLGTLSEVQLDIFCCARKDAEGFKLAQLRDKVMNYLIDTSQTDGMARITLYKSSATEAWTNIGGMVVQILSESPQMDAEDNTKFKSITVSLRWGGKC